MINFRKIFFYFILSITISFLVWICVLLLFVFSNNPNNFKEIIKENSLIVVLTGGKGRIEHGLNLLKNEKAKFLIISGVFEEEKIIEKYNLNNIKNSKRCCIFFEDKSRNTIENAREVKEWLRREKININSIQLVTSYYHMPRGVVIFKKVFPDKKIFRETVVSNLGINKELFFHVRLIISEYLKIFYTLIYLP